MLKVKETKKAKGKPGRKASGLRELPPEAARLAVNKATLGAVTEALDLQRRARAMAMSNEPTLLRLVRGDVQVSSVMVIEDGEISMRPVLRGASMQSLLMDAGMDKRLAWVAEKFLVDVEGCRIGKLTASYGEGLGGAVSAEPLRVLQALDRLGRAQRPLNTQERTAVWGLFVFDLPLTDVGWCVAGHRFGSRGEPLRNAAALIAEAGLERMAPYYEARGEDG